MWAPRAQADKRGTARGCRSRSSASQGSHGSSAKPGACCTSTDASLASRWRTATGTAAARSSSQPAPPERSRARGVRAAAAGRGSEPPAGELAESIRSFGFKMGRLKTGTPPRLSARSIDFDRAVRDGVFHEERGDSEPSAFSFMATTRPVTRSAAGCCTPMRACASWCARTSARARSTTARSKASVRATVPRSRTRSCASPIGSDTKSILSPKASAPTRST